MTKNDDDFSYRRTYRGPLQGIILDWAGTTLDYGCYAPAIVFREVFKRQGVEITIDEAREPMGAHKLVHIRKISQIPGVARKWREVHGHPFAEENVQAMFEDFVPRQLACLADYADLIPGTVETVEKCRHRGYKIGSTTGYTNEMMKILLDEAGKRGYQPDATVCSTDVPAGRPEPWMCLENAKILGIFPMEAIVKIGDTLPDIEEGLNAGMWTIGLTKTGNEMGLNEAEINALDPAEYERRMRRADRRMKQAGAHFVVDGISDVMPCLDEIERHLAAGQRP